MADLLDLDAAIREQVDPDGIDMPFRGAVFHLPAELPLDVFDPFLDPEFDLVGLIRTFVEADKDEKADVAETVVDVLFERPNLPREVLDAFYGSLRLLFGAEQFEQFQAKRPGHKTYTIFIRLLLAKYGVGLGEAFASADSSENGGETSKPTSPTSTTDSTPAKPSAAAKRKKASSASAGSETS